MIVDELLYIYISDQRQAAVRGCSGTDELTSDDCERSTQKYEKQIWQLTVLLFFFQWS